MALIYLCILCILAPKNNHKDHYNQKGWYSMLLKDVVGHKRDIHVYSEQCNMQELGMGNVLVYDSRIISKAIQVRQR